MALFDRREKTGKWWVDHSLSLVVLAVLLIQTFLSIILGFRVWKAEELTVGFWHWYAYEWFLSTLADIYGILAVVLLTKWFYERGSAESK